MRRGHRQSTLPVPAPGQAAVWFMEFNSFHNPIKMEGAAGAAGWSVSATTPPHSDPKKVNPFMQWAIFNSGIYFAPGSGGQPQPGPGSQAGSTPPSDLSGSGRTSLECRPKYCGFKTKQKTVQPGIIGAARIFLPILLFYFPRFFFVLSTYFVPHFSYTVIKINLRC